MTSTENNKETVEFFEEHNYFGYPKDHIKFFIQGNLPLLFTNGQLVLDKDYSIKEAADGNGCIYKAMREDKILEDMENRNVEWAFIGSVDNVLLNMVDPILIGLTIEEKHEVASKSIAKKDPSERVGVFCKANGVPSVIEYSELPKEMAELRDKDGELLYGEAHIMCNLFSIKALEKISKIDLPYHVANKKTNYMNEKGEFVEVTEPNAYKFEAFIFDAFNFFDDMSILRGRREEDFAPVKNKEGNDSPNTAKELYNNYWRK
jgi:UDP-N-acetylglucosamine/UDP-N-acetylgalactosamine diphosphorylase